MQVVELPTHISGDWWNGMGPITVKINGDPLNISGNVIKMQIRKTRKPGEPVLAEWSTEDNTIEITDGVNGVFTIKGRALTLPGGNLFSDVQLITTDSKIYTIIPEIVWNIKSDITR